MSRPWILFAHGAGASSQSEWMQRWANHLQDLGPVVRFDYPYMAAGRKRPDPLPRLLEAHREALAQGEERHGTGAVLVGKSMGGRVGCHLALQADVLAVVCLGYPLRKMGKTRPLRDQVLLQLERPACFVQGTRDRLCPLEELRAVLNQRQATSHLVVVDTGDHSLMATKTHLKQQSTTQEDLDRAAVSKVARFVESVQRISRSPTVPNTLSQNRFDTQ